MPVETISRSLAAAVLTYVGARITTIRAAENRYARARRRHGRWRHGLLVESQGLALASGGIHDAAHWALTKSFCQRFRSLVHRESSATRSHVEPGRSGDPSS